MRQFKKDHPYKLGLLMKITNVNCGSSKAEREIPSKLLMDLAIMS